MAIPHIFGFEMRSPMETFTLDKDIGIFYITASSFPDGVLAAHQQLHHLVPFSLERNYFGLSRPENGDIVYRAAAEELFVGEALQFGCEAAIIRQGKYVVSFVNNFKEDPQLIGTSFQELLKTPGLDPQGYCVEWYLNDENSVRCMIRLA